MNLLESIRSYFPGKSSEVRSLSEQLEVTRNNFDLLKESIASLELGLEDIGWLRLLAESDREFSRAGLTEIIRRSRYMFLKNPLINRAVTIQSYYVWGQGVTIKCEDETEQAAIDAFMDDPKNRAELTCHQTRTMKEQTLQVTGNLFFVFFPDTRTGAVRVRSIPVDEIQDIVCNPEDSKDPWFYRRVWSQATTAGGSPGAMSGYYPDLMADPAKIAGVSLPNGKMLEYPVYHVKVGGLDDMRFGVPETYQALDWAKAYKDTLEDDATRSRALAKFAWNMSTKGGSKGIAAAKTKLGTTQTTSVYETNPPPLVGSTFIGQEGVTMDPVKIAGAMPVSDHARPMKLMVCAAVGLPETFLGDVSVGTLATAKSLDRPTELKFTDRQELWKSILQTILGYVVRVKTNSKEVSKINVSFPPILEHDIDATVSSWVKAATLDGKQSAGTVDKDTLSRALLTALGAQNIDEIMEKVVAEEEERQAKADEIAAQMKAAAPVPGAVPGQKPEPPIAQTVEAMMIEAVRELRAKLGEM
jgi:hypothetical protein